MTITEFLEYILDNSDGPVTFSVAGAKVSVNLEGERDHKPVTFGKAISLAEARQIALKASKPRKSYSMREVSERTVRGANNLGAEWVAGHTIPGPNFTGASTSYLRSKKIPFTIFYGPNGKGTKMAFVNRKDLKFNA